MKGQKCKDCKAPIYSQTEKDQGLCTACAYKKRQNRSQLQKPTADKEVDKEVDKEARYTKPDNRYTKKGSAFRGANNRTLTVKIPEKAMIALQNEAKLAGMTVSTYLRGLILGAITVRKAR